MVIATLALVVVLLAIAPAVQTWVAQHELTSTPGVKGSLDTLSAGFGEVDVENLHLETHGVVLTLPSLKAKLALSDAILHRQFRIQSLVAKGWSLDFSQSSGEAGAPPAGSATVAGAGSVTRADTASLRRSLDAILGILSQRQLPYDGSLDGVDMEGDILFTPFPGRASARVHIVLSGGGLSVGNAGAFDFDLSGTIPDTSLPVNAASAHGKLSISMDAQRTLNRIRIDADLTDNSSSNQPSITVGAEVSSGKDSQALTYGLDLTRAGRKFISVTANVSGPKGQVSGTWVVDLIDSDISRYFPDVPSPSGTLEGTGRFDTDLDFSRLHVVGSMASSVSHLERVSPSLSSVSDARIQWEFDDTRSGHEVRVDRLKVSISGARPVAVITSLQPFVIDEKAWALTSSDAARDVFDVSILGLPLAWLPALPGGVTISGGNAVGELLIAHSGAGFDLRSKGPVSASGASVQQAGTVVAKGLGLTLALTAHEDPKGWQAGFSPLGIDSGGRRLASLEGSATRATAGDAGVAINLKWNADLAAIEAEGAAPAAGWLSGRNASGDLSATFGATTVVDGKIAVEGRDPRHSVTATAHAEIDSDGGVAFQAPVKIAFGASASDLKLEGSFSRDSGGPWIDLKMTGGRVALGDLMVLAAPFAPKDLVSAGSSAGKADRTPFWGKLTGQVAVSFDQFSTNYIELSNVGGSFTIDKRSIELEGGRGGPTGNVLTNVKGSVFFENSPDAPYVLKGAASSTDLEASSVFPKPRSGEDPVFEGKFNVTRAFTGKGKNLYDLATHAGEEFHITSASGIVRMLKTNVADSITEAPSSVASNTLSTVGSVVGTVMGTKANILDSGKTKLSKNTEAVLDLTYQVAELGYDSLDITAFRGYDGAIAITQLDMVSPEVRLTGSGKISNAKGVALADQALSLDLQLGAQGKTEELLSKSKLLSTVQDDRGYSLLSQALHFGGTLSHVDASQWTDLLVKAAAPKPEPEKKGD